MPDFPSKALETYSKEWQERTVLLVNQFCDQVAAETDSFPNADMPGTIFANALCLIIYTLNQRAGLDRVSAEAAIAAALDVARQGRWFPEDKAAPAAGDTTQH
jgi:hypothetical protein